jgi:hypothetical protein
LLWCKPKRRDEVLYVSLISCGALALSALSLKALPMPFVWIGLTWAVALIGGLFCLHGTLPRGSLACLHGTGFRALLFNVSIAAVAFAAVEVYLSLHEPTSATYAGNFYVKDDLLGTALAKGARVHVTSGRSFDVTYTTDANGLRIAPPVQDDKHAECILFFGCSFLFGHGLEDDQTLPYQVGLQSGGRYRTFNFAVPGYGPHHMLAEIEGGRVGRIADCSPKYAIYLALAHHAKRASGKVFSSMHGPRYVLDPDGIPRRVGNFGEQEKVPSPFEAELRWQLGKSAIYRRLTQIEPRIDKDDVRLMLAIVGRSRDLLAAEYPGIQFHVILWPSRQGDQAVAYRELQEGFRQMNIPVHRVEDILLGDTFTFGSSKYAISATDSHPNALADRLLANYVLTKIVSTEPSASRSPR